MQACCLSPLQSPNGRIHKPGIVIPLRSPIDDCHIIMCNVSDGPTESAPLGSGPSGLALTLGSCRYDAELSAAAAARKLDALRVYGASEESAGRLKARVLRGELPARDPYIDWTG